MRRGRLGLGLGAAALVAALVAVAVSSGGGDSENVGGSGSGGAGQVVKESKAQPRPKPLSRSELIGKADAICEDSQATYTSVFSQELEEAPNVAYASTLVGISSSGAERFRKLKRRAPSSVEPAFGQYVEAQERVMHYDRQALDAAQSEDAAGYVAARRRRDDEMAERYDLARRIGLEQCSLKR